MFLKKSQNYSINKTVPKMNKIENWLVYNVNVILLLYYYYFASIINNL